MISLAISIKDEIGFHARTASLFAKKASKFESFLLNLIEKR